MKIIMIHGWRGFPREGWFPWLKKELEKGVRVEIPRMPNAEKPKLEQWLRVLDSLVAGDEEIILMGHSLGCRTILKFAEENKVHGMILVAGRTGKSFFKILDNFYEKPVQWKRVRRNCKHIVGIYSDNDPVVSLSNANELKKKLGARIIIEHGKGHMGEDSGVKRLESVLQAVLDMLKS